MTALTAGLGSTDVSTFIDFPFSFFFFIIGVQIISVKMLHDIH